MRILLVQTFYPEFLRRLYEERPDLTSLPFVEQRAAVFATFFGVGDAYSHGLRQAGCEAEEVICNADVLQGVWAAEHGVSLSGNIHDQRRQIVAAQVEAYRPDVLYVFEWSPLGDAFLHTVREHVTLLAGQIASPLPANRTFAAYDVMFSSWPPIVEHFRSQGAGAEHFRLGFDLRVPEALSRRPGNRDAGQHEVTFVGGFAPSHTDRVAWLETILAETPVDVFAYGLDSIPGSSPIHQAWRGEAWGLQMYEVLARSKVTINLHASIDVRGTISREFANNMRLYEATGVGTCLLTERRPGLASLFEPDVEVATFADAAECAVRIRDLLADAPRRGAIAAAGRKRTLAEHGYPRRMEELADLLSYHLRRSSRGSWCSGRPVREAALL